MQLIEHGGAIPLPSPLPRPTLEAQLEAAIRTPPVGRLARRALLALTVTLLPLGGWATMTHIEQAVLGTGQLIPEGKRKTVTLLEPGILRRLMVKEGSSVEAGQTLALLDVTQAETAADQAKAAFWSGRARIARLRAEQDDRRGLSFPADLEKAAAADPAIAVFLEAERAFFAARWANFDSQVAAQEKQVTQAREQMLGARAQKEGAERQLRSVREQIAGLSRLLVQGFASRFSVLELQRDEAMFGATVGSAGAQETQFREAMAQAEKQLASLRFTRLSDIANDVQTTEAAVAAAAQQLRAAQDILTRREVVAPEAGRVTNIQMFSPGSSIGAGQPILELVPAHDRLIVEGQVQPTDIEQVAVGQRTNLRLTAYRMRELPVLPGRLIHVAPDISTNQNGAQFYTVRAELAPEALARFPDVRLFAGMPVEIYVLGEDRTPLSYFWTPFRHAARRAFRD
ncbi:HlyD family type I secretion periplasmic adaptor subunit [Paracraurococcus lichenis]|uniref:Membrane fusion protein (MFP) family protein n=1 Tax=Paracraurococcus lichenis TaxID=3064888 RepID=A0ABT9E5I4_9PROT|nr:HlyD family type I secretion periplasmic adaptor subunit [Paracraurococcus sp. LOR1-02]MDO9711413.1 HlyD family type I secretion periplasmic adaptor subunit [Paracraurococcus sp. LOR1-02]